MLTLFNQYRNSGRMTEAILVGRNLFNRDPGDEKVFSAYFDLLCYLAKGLPRLEERKEFAGMAEIALEFFSENAQLDEAAVEEIAVRRQLLAEIIGSIEAAQQELAAQEIEEIQAHNTNCLRKLYTLAASIKDASDRKVFEKALTEISAIDRQISKDALTDEQSSHYDSLTKACTEDISAKMRELEHRENIDYNKKAVDAYEKAFQSFQKEESKYKAQTQLFNLVSQTLFAYEAARLFSETLIYYNHVYSYIFNKLDDAGKAALTRFSISCGKKQR